MTPDLPSLKIHLTLEEPEGPVCVEMTLHADERDGPSGGEAILSDPETGRRLSLNLEDVRADYRRRMRDFIGQWSSLFRSRGVDHHVTLVGEDPVDVLRRYMIQRAVRA